MSGWLRFLLGLDEGEIPPGGVARFELAGMPSGWWAAVSLFIVLLAIALVVLIYRRESELGFTKRLVLAGLRLVALAAVVLVLLNPRLLVELQARRPAQTLLLVDGSGSMGSRDSYTEKDRSSLRQVTGLDPASGPGEGRTRAELAAGALRRSGLAEKLGQVNRVRGYVIDEGLTAVEPAALPAAALAAPEGARSTWLGSAVHAALEAARADPVAAVVLITDGRSNGGDSLAGAGAELESRGIPLHALGVGRVDVKKNIAVVEVNAPEVAETGLPLKVRVRLRATGFPGDVEVKLSRARLGDKSFEPVGAETVPLREIDAEAVVNLTDVPPRDGRYRYLAEVEPRPGEENPRDNRRTADVVVASEKCRLLLIAGSPTFEFRYLKNFFIRDAGIQVSAWLESADPQFPQEGDIPIKSLPATEADLRPYDVVVLIDPDPQALPPGFAAALERFVSEVGGGLAYVAGEHYTRGLSRSSEGVQLAALLPVDLPDADPGHHHPRPWRPELTSAGATHTLCQFRPQAEENRSLWASLPRFYFRFPAGGLRPGATTLLATGQDPVAAVHQPGAGRVLFLATGDLWRWRAYREEIHEQFWSGAARFLALGKRLAGTRQVAISTDRERYLLGDEVRVEAHVVDASHKPLGSARVVAAIERAEAAHAGDGAGEGSGEGSGEPAAEGEGTGRRQELPLEAVQGRPGWFRGRLKLDLTGSYRVSLAEAGAEGSPAAFRVARPSGESEDTTPDFAALSELARRSGGSFGTLADIEKVPARIPDRTVVEVLGRKTATIWDSATLLLVFAGALIVEWSLRKKWRLC